MYLKKSLWYSLTISSLFFSSCKDAIEQPTTLIKHGYIQIGDSSNADYFILLDTIYSVPYPESANTAKIDLDRDGSEDVIFRCKGGKSDYSWGYGAYAQVYNKCLILTEICTESTHSHNTIGSPLDFSLILNDTTRADTAYKFIEGYPISFIHSSGTSIKCIENDIPFYLGFIINEDTKKYCWVKLSVNTSEKGSRLIIHSYAIRT